MPKFDKFDKKGVLVETFYVSDETLRNDPEAVVKMRFDGGDRDAQANAASAAKNVEGYEFLCEQDGDPDALVADTKVYVFAKKGSFERVEATASGVGAFKQAVANMRKGAEELAEMREDASISAGQSPPQLGAKKVK